MARTIAFDTELSDGSFLAACVKFDGNVTQMARHFNVSIDAMYQFFKRTPEAKLLLDEVRGLNNEVILDLAEHVIKFNLMNYKNDRKLAQRAAEKVIDKKGHSRGWHDVVNPTPPGDSALNELISEIRLEREVKSGSESQAEAELQ